MLLSIQLLLEGYDKLRIPLWVLKTEIFSMGRFFVEDVARRVGDYAALSNFEIKACMGMPKHPEVCFGH